MSKPLTRNELNTSTDIANLVVSFLPYRFAMRCKKVNKTWSQIQLELRPRDFEADCWLLRIATCYYLVDVIDKWSQYKLSGMMTVGNMDEICIRNIILNAPQLVARQFDFEHALVVTNDATSICGGMQSAILAMKLYVYSGRVVSNRHIVQQVLKQFIGFIGAQPLLYEKHLEIDLYEAGFLDVALHWLEKVTNMEQKNNAIQSLYIHAIEKRRDPIAAEVVLSLFTVNGKRQQYSTWSYIFHIIVSYGLYSHFGNWIAPFFYNCLVMLLPNLEHRSFSAVMGLDLFRSPSIELHLFLRQIPAVGLGLRMLASARSYLPW